VRTKIVAKNNFEGKRKIFGDFGGDHGPETAGGPPNLMRTRSAPLCYKRFFQ